MKKLMVAGLLETASRRLGVTADISLREPAGGCR